MVVVDVCGVGLYLDDRLRSDLDRVCGRVVENDEDRFFVVDGREGSGKSVLAMQLAGYVDPSFCLERVVFTSDDFKSAIMSAKRGQAIVFDEAFNGLSSKGSVSKENKRLVKLLMECRQKNLIVFIVMPMFFILERYVAIFRASGLFHTYRSKDGKRGFWMFFNFKAKKQLYIEGSKKYWSYDSPRASYRGVFSKKYLVDEALYRAKKLKYLGSESEDKEKVVGERFENQRNFLFWYMNKHLNLSLVDIAGLLCDYGFVFSKSGVHKAVEKFEKSKEEKENV